MSVLPFPPRPAPASLAGATRAEIARALAEIGAPERELRMRASQLWHWIYHRGAREFSAMRNIARPLLEKLAERHTLARPEIVAEQVSADGTRKWLLRMPPAGPGDKGAEIETRLHPRVRPRHAVRLEPGRLHPQLHVLPYRHAELGAQPHGGRDRRRRFWSRATGSAIFPAASRRPTGSSPPAKACARSPTSSSWAWASRSTISTTCARRSASSPTATACRCRSGASPSRPPASCRKWRASARECGDDARRLAARDQRRAARQAGAAQQEISDRRAACRPAATIPAPPTRGASPSNTSC